MHADCCGAADAFMHYGIMSWVADLMTLVTCSLIGWLETCRCSLSAVRGKRVIQEVVAGPPAGEKPWPCGTHAPGTLHWWPGLSPRLV